MPFWAIGVAASVLLSDCSGRNSSGDASIPRQRAYPRVEVDSAVYVAVEGLPLHMEVNAASRASLRTEKDGILWLDVAYPALGATIHYTLVPVSSSNRAEITANRTERMALNAGDNASELTSLESAGGFRGELLVTRQGTPTPVQSLGIGERWLVSGAAYLPAAATAATDSVAPIVGLLEADMLRALQSLAPVE